MERDCHEEESRAYFSKRCERDDLSNARVNPPRKNGDEDEDEEWVGGLDLGRKDIDTEDITVHFFGLKY